MSDQKKMKLCKKCKEEKDIDHFYKLGENENTGKTYYSSNCKTCNSSRSLDYYHEVRKIKDKRHNKRGPKQYEEKYPDKINQLKEMLENNPRISYLQLAKQTNTAYNTIRGLFDNGVLSIRIAIVI